MPLAPGLLAGLTLGLALVIAPPPEPTGTSPGMSPGTSPATSPTQGELPRLAFVAAEGVEGPALEAEIAMRLPDLRVTRLEGAVPDEPFIYIQARRETGKLHRVAIIFSDGRAYYEHVDVGDAGSPERVLASAIVNLLFSIESGAVEPDQRGVAAPLVRETSPEPEPSATEPEPGPESESEPKPDASTPRLELGLGLGLGQLTGLGAPRFADAHLGWFGSVEFGLRTAKGLYAAIEFRPGGSSKAEVRLTRLRTAVSLGYAWRSERLEILVAAGIAVVPWVVSSEGRSEAVTAIDDGTTGRPPLLSFGARLSPGYRVAVDGSPVRGIRIGPRLEAGGGFVTSSPPRVAGLQSKAGDELFRLGGVELYAGLELCLWLSPRSPG